MPKKRGIIQLSVLISTDLENEKNCAKRLQLHCKCAHGLIFQHERKKTQSVYVLKFETVSSVISMVVPNCLTLA